MSAGAEVSSGSVDDAVFVVSVFSGTTVFVDAALLSLLFSAVGELGAKAVEVSVLGMESDKKDVWPYVTSSPEKAQRPPSGHVVLGSHSNNEMLLSGVTGWAVTRRIGLNNVKSAMAMSLVIGFMLL